jgi:hypothetical protein
MKKLIAVCAVLLFVAPAFAADWAFYGSERMATWYTQKDNGADNNLVLGQVNGQGDDSATQFYFQGNSRVGARVKADKVNGRIELRLANESNEKTASSGGDTNVGTRLAWGEWKFAEDMSLKVGKMDSTATNIINNRMFNGDDEMLGQGQFYGKRPAGIELNIHNFALGMFTPNVGGDVNAYAGTATGFANATNGEGDAYLPKFEAKYKLDLGAGYIQPFGGFQWYKVAPSGTGTVYDKLDVYSYVAGVGTMWNIGAFSIGGEASYGMNMGNANWAAANTAASRLAYMSSRFGDSDVRNVYTTQAELVAALKFTDTLRFEAGAGYTVDNAVNAPGYSRKDDQWMTYAQCLVTLAPGVYVIPEAGYTNFLNDRSGKDEGWQWYAGAKWMIDF